MDCPVEDIAAYLDGELTPDRELAIEAHFAVCPGCVTELNQQKQFLCSLESSLRAEQEIELPADFTKHIVATAETSVAGLRRPRERYDALFVFAALLIFVLFAFGSEAGRMIDSVLTSLERAALVGSLFGHLFYSFLVGLVIVVRSFASQVGSEPAAATAFFGFVLGVGILLASRKMQGLRHGLKIFSR